MLSFTRSLAPPFFLTLAAFFLALTSGNCASADAAACTEHLPVDLNADCYVNLDDLRIFADHWLVNECEAPNWCAGADIGQSSQVEWQDFSLLAGNWLDCTDPNPPCNYLSATAVPGGYNHDFELGLDGWQNAGSAFIASHNHNGLLPWKGDYHLWSAEQYAVSDMTAATGTLKSAIFRIATVDPMTFYLCGIDGTGPQGQGLNYVRLVRTSDMAVLHQADCPQSDTWHRIIWDIAPYAGTDVHLEICDANPDPDNGWIAVDDLEAGRDQLLSPWTPVQVTADSIDCWGREYHWQDLPTPSQVVSQGESLLASSIKMRLKVDGQLASWSSSAPQDPPQLTSDTTVAATITRAVQGLGVAVTGRATVEFDGMMRIDFTIAPVAGPVNVTNFWIEIPFVSERSDLMYLWYQPYYGERTTGPTATYTGPFHPICWLGDEEAGLCWFAESDQGWLPTANPQAIQIFPAGGQNLFIINIWADPHVLQNAEQFTMGLQATPVKSLPSDWHQRSIAGNVNWYNSDGSAALQELADLGVQTISSGENWAAVQNFPEPWCCRYPPINSKLYSSGAMPLNTWTHVAGSWDSSTGAAVLYINGVAVDTMGNFGGLAGTGRPFVIGGDKSVNQNRLFDGVMDEVRVYDRFLGAGQVQSAMNAAIPAGPAGMIHAYNFEAGSGTTVYDRIAVNPQDGTFGPVKSAADWTTGKYGGGLRFYGTDVDGDDYVDFGSDSSFAVTETGTVMAWVKEITHDSGSFFMQKGIGADFPYMFSSSTHWNATVLEMLTGDYYCSCADPAGDTYDTLVSQIHQYGLKTIPYFGFQISDIAPIWDQYGDECFALPRDYEPYRREASASIPPQECWNVCYRSRYVDLMLDSMIDAQTKYDIDGVYLDATTSPFNCTNTLHGCGFDSGGGSIRGTYQLFAYRSMMKRMNAIFVQNGGLIEAHTQMCICPPIISFATSLLDGEWLYILGDPGQHILNYASLESWRAHWGHHWGIPTRSLDPTPDPFTEEELMSIIMLQDVFIRPSNGRTGQLQRIMPILNLFADFGADLAQWFGYWDNHAFVSSSHPSDIRVSFFTRPDNNTMLLMVSNLGNSDISNATVTLDLPALGLSPMSTAAMWVYDQGSQSVSVSNGTVTLGPLPTCTPRVVLLE